MVKIGDQKLVYSPSPEPQPTLTMARFLLRPVFPGSSAQDNPPDPMDQLATGGGNPLHVPHSQPPGSLTPLTAEVLDAKLNSLLENITHNISLKVGKIAQELREEIDHLGERTDTLETKFDELVQYVHVLEEDNVYLKHTVTQIHMQQDDLENREHRQNLRFRGVPETVGDQDLRSYLLSLFNTVDPDIPDIDWRLDRAHRSLAPKPPC